MSLPPLANAELAVMELLWTEQPLTARAIRERLYPRATKAQHGTVQRLLQRLEDKGYVARDRTLATHLFSPTVSREDYAAGQLEALAEKLTGGSVAPFLTRLLAEKKLSRKEIQQLRALLDEATDEGSQK